MFIMILYFVCIFRLFFEAVGVEDDVEVVWVYKETPLRRLYFTQRPTRFAGTYKTKQKVLFGIIKKPTF